MSASKLADRAGNTVRKDKHGIKSRHLEHGHDLRRTAHQRQLAAAVLDGRVGGHQ